MKVVVEEFWLAVWLADRRDHSKECELVEELVVSMAGLMALYLAGMMEFWLVVLTVEMLAAASDDEMVEE